jgi:ArsR family transcriptional regulator
MFADRVAARYPARMPDTRRRGDEAASLRAFKASFFRALGHPQRIHILELLRSRPLSVGQLQEATGSPGSSVSQHLGVLRTANVVAAERRGTTVLYRVPDPELFELLDVARRIFNIHLADTIDILRLSSEATDAAEAPEPGEGPPEMRARRGAIAV